MVLPFQTDVNDFANLCHFLFGQRSVVQTRFQYVDCVLQRSDVEFGVFNAVVNVGQNQRQMQLAFPGCASKVMEMIVDVVGEEVQLRICALRNLKLPIDVLNVGNDNSPLMHLVSKLSLLDFLQHQTWDALLSRPW